MAYIDEIRLPSFKIILIFVCMTLVGLFLVSDLPIKLEPKNETPQLTISFSMPRMQSRVVEMEVTSRIESMLSRVKGVQGVSSTSGNGWGRVNIKLNKHVAIDVARFEISTVIRQLYPLLPKGVSYPQIVADQTDQVSKKPFLIYTLNAPSSSILIQEYAEKNIKNKLSYIDGVDVVDISGANPMIWKLIYDNEQLKRYRITVDDIQTAIQYYLKKEFLGLGQIESLDHTKNWIRLTITPANSSNQFMASDIVVKNQDGKMIRLDELVTVSHLEESPTSYNRINGLNSVTLSITAKDRANQLKLAKAIKKETARMDYLFPSNYEMHLVYDSTEYIQAELDSIVLRSGLTILILLGFILLVYQNLNYLLMIAISLFCNLAMAVVFYTLFKLEIHLYSLMGITISLSLMLDNIIVMSDQIHRQKNRKAFLAILTSAMTTVAALVMIFFMDEKIRLNLLDFAIVIMINLGVSLSVVFFLVPAIMDKFRIAEKKKKSSLREKRRIAGYNRFYRSFIRITTRKRILVFGLGLLFFGLPVFMLPEEIKPKNDEKLSEPSRYYNATIGSSLYQKKIKPVTDVLLGGTLRLFVEKVVEGSYWKSNEETTLHVDLYMPNGSTLQQTDHLVRIMEDYLGKFHSIRQFHTNVERLRGAISIRLQKNAPTGQSKQLMDKLTEKALALGGGSWSVYGLGNGFNNSLLENAGPVCIKMQGYNYDNLYAYAEQVRDTLLSMRRIKDVTIDSRFSYIKSDYQEFAFDLNKENLIQENLNPQTIFSELDNQIKSNSEVGNWETREGSDPIRLYSQQVDSYDIWKLNHMPSQSYVFPYKLSYLAKIEKYQAPQDIVREDQQYQLAIQYLFVGSSKQSGRVLKKNIERMSKILPIGYSIKAENDDSWLKNETMKNYLLLLIVVFIIYFSTSILFNSVKQPLAILLIIPVSYIGLFLTFYVFKLNFDQGGFAAFVLLSGITVNAGVYIVNQYNTIQRMQPMAPLRAYIKAWNYRIVPISLTVVSTILGFVPFLVGERQGFWFPLAAGVIGGLVMSLVGLFIFLPMYLGVGTINKNPHKL